MAIIDGIKARLHPEELRELYWDKQLSTVEIAPTLNVCASTVLNYMHRFGIQRRSTSEATALFKQKKRGDKFSLETFIQELRRENSQIGGAEIGRRLNITREAARLCLKKLHLPTRLPRKGVCQNCGIPISRPGLCVKCWRKSLHTIINCEVCGREKEVLISRLKWRLNHGQKHFLCGRRCVGFWTHLTLPSPKGDSI